MKTIRRKISVGFLALIVVLFFSGVIAYAEMNRLRKDTELVIAQGTEATEFAKRMLNALQTQNSAVLKMIILGNQTPSEEYTIGLHTFNTALQEAISSSADTKDLEKIAEANKHYHAIVEIHASTITTESADRDWYMSSYVDAYYALDTAIKDYMSSPSNSIAVRTSRIEDSIYRTITPSILTLIVAIVIVCMFYFFIDTYYTRPVQRISKALGFYVESKLPYKVKIDEKSELMDLNNNIIELIEQNKKQQ